MLLTTDSIQTPTPTPTPKDLLKPALSISKENECNENAQTSCILSWEKNSKRISNYQKERELKLALKFVAVIRAGPFSVFALLMGLRLRALCL